MNVVLQALAHAPELMLALDCESHCATCPTYLANLDNQRNSPSPPAAAAAAVASATVQRGGVRKSRRTSPPTNSNTNDSIDDNTLFCTLCELELHLKLVHAAVSQNVAPSSFVHGFLNHVAPWFKLGVQEDSHEFLRLLIDAMQKSCDAARANKMRTDTSNDCTQNATEYPFKLFRGTVESNVVCDSCHATSAKIDPIEDIGLEVSRNSAIGNNLSDVHSAFATFSREEALEGYKCDKCNILGSAKKQSRLASIPPIFTLHLKRFRYGSDGKPIEPSSRRGREVNQLLGASGSAKIEGHVKFLEIFDLKPFLTETLQAQHKSMFCRLFAVIVHAGKNSHSGHYIAYVRNLTKNEWWRMDDSRVTRATSNDVLSAEAYMLFYRVVDHPVSKELREKARCFDETVKEEPMNNNSNNDDEQNCSIAIIDHINNSNSNNNSNKANNNINKRKRPEYSSGEEWARQKTRLSPSLCKVFRRAEEFISDHIEFKPEFFKLMIDEAEAGRNNGPSGICDDDVLGGVMERFRNALLELFHKVASRTGDAQTFLKPAKDIAKASPSSTTTTPTIKPIIVPVIDDGDLL